MCYGQPVETRVDKAQQPLGFRLVVANDLDEPCFERLRLEDEARGHPQEFGLCTFGRRQSRHRAYMIEKTRMVSVPERDR